MFSLCTKCLRSSHFFQTLFCAQDIEIVEKNQQHRISQYPGMEMGKNVKKCLQITSHTILELHIASDI